MKVDFTYNGIDGNIYGIHFMQDGELTGRNDFINSDVFASLGAYDNGWVQKFAEKLRDCAILATQAADLSNIGADDYNGVTREKRIKHEIINLRKRVKRCRNGLEVTNLNREISKLENELRKIIRGV